MKKSYFPVFIILILCVSIYCHSQKPLCPSDCENLKPEAREHYDKALEHIDRVYWKGALEELREAAKADPDHVNLHFFLARVARQRARIETSLEESQKYYTIAENALLSFQNREDLTRDQQAYLENSMGDINKEKSSLEMRERKRTETGNKIIMEYLNQIGWFAGTTPAATDASAAGSQAVAPGASFATPGAFGSSAGSSPFGVSPNLSGSANATSPFGATGASPFGGASPQPQPSAGSSPFGTPGSPEPSAPSAASPSNPFATP
ncbi:nucleoporin [Candidatus Sumerlaeota bacterium]|nr:nucleoporin [Candidatus Sumerlaeota bacterium]